MAAPDAGGRAPGTTPVRKVLVVTDSLVVGGAERQLTLLVGSMPPEWEARVASFGDGVYAPILRDAGVPLDMLLRASRFDVRPGLALGRIIRRWRPDVVHTWGWMSVAASLPACRRLGIPIVDGTIRSGRVLPYRGRMMRLMSKRADVVIANSQAGLDAFGIDPRKSTVVHNGFDPERWGLCEPSEKAARPFTAVMTGRMSRDKDYRCLLASARLLHSEDPGGWRFECVGTGEDREGLIASCRDLVEAGAVAFPEAGTEVLEVVRRAHAGVLLTDPAFAAEGLSNSIMEYMACGLPVVCTLSGGNGELVIDGRTGVMVPPSDATSVAVALRDLRGDPARAESLGRAGRARIAESFTVDAMVRGTVDAYEAAIGGRRAPARVGSPGRADSA